RRERGARARPGGLRATVLPPRPRARPPPGPERHAAEGAAGLRRREGGAPMSDDPNGPRVSDPFPLTSDPATYFPRLAFESALAELIEALAEAPPCAALIGEPGLGKTLLLHVLEERLEGAYECVSLPYPRLEGEELWAFVAAALGLQPSEDARAAGPRLFCRPPRGGEGAGGLVERQG